MKNIVRVEVTNTKKDSQNQCEEFDIMIECKGWSVCKLLEVSEKMDVMVKQMRSLACYLASLN
jgi:hypothetical protein